ncbi:MAG: hypothetical protein AB2L20_27575 [Mangrovibacterium sp.]
MELILITLMLFVALNTLLKLSFWNTRAQVVFGMFAGAFVYAMYPLAIGQSKTQLADFLNNTGLMQNVSVLVSLESAAFLLFCFLEVGLPKKGQVWYLKLLRWFPGVLIFPVLFHTLTRFIFAWTGASFSLLAALIAVFVGILIPFLGKFLLWVLHEREMRLEVLFLSSLFIITAGLVATVNGTTTYQAETAIDRKAFLAVVLLIAFGLLIGVAWFKIRLRKRRN